MQPRGRTGLDVVTEQPLELPPTTMKLTLLLRRGFGERSEHTRLKIDIRRPNVNFDHRFLREARQRRVVTNVGLLNTSAHRLNHCRDVRLDHHRLVITRNSVHAQGTRMCDVPAEG